MKLKKAFLIQMLICLVTGLGWFPVAFATPAPATSQVQTVQTLEQTLFASHYDQDSLETRVGRLEETVFGQKQSGFSLDARIAKLKSALSPGALGPLSPLSKPAPEKTAGTPKQSAPSQTRNASPRPVAQQPNNSGPNPQNVANQPAAPTPGETDYPTVGQMEQKLFGKTYTQEDITQRLARLEKQVFKVPQTGALVDRVDNLRMVVLGDIGNGTPTAGYTGPGGAQPNYGPQYSQMPGNSGQYSGGSYQSYAPPRGNYGYNNAYGGNNAYPGSQVSSGGQPYGQQPMPANYQPQAYNNGSGYQSSAYQPAGAYQSASNNGQVTPDMLAAMDEVEKQVLGNTYPSEPINTRLDRVENKVFHATSSELPPQDRIQRVIAVASAGGTPMTAKGKAKASLQVLLPIILTLLPLVLL